MSQKPVPSVAVPQSVVSAEAVSVALEAAVAKAAELGVKINVAVADSGGNLSGFLRMPGAGRQWLFAEHVLARRDEGQRG